MAVLKLTRIGEEDYRSNEAYKALRTNISFCGTDVKCIAITSCTPNEGKSSVAMNLAISLADDGKKVLLVDADLRKSVLVGRQHINKSVMGLSHFLSGQCKLEDTINTTGIKGFHIILTGPFPPNPAELLNGRLFKAALKALRDAYDYIIIDTPPLGSVIDCAVIAAECDAATMVLVPGEISYKFAQRVKAQLDKTGCRFLGVILNKVEMNNSKYYGKYYGDYYGTNE